jgi:hypothetical protein
VLKRSQSDAPASVETGSALGARQFETLPVGLTAANQQNSISPDTLVAFPKKMRRGRWDGRFCANTSAMALDHTPGMAIRALAWSCREIAPSE